ncbi:MAG: response regulator [Cyanobacteria bacterium J007]|nr:MAG: response regulator [Cyanobacteria bacterium J007]
MSTIPLTLKAFVRPTWVCAQTVSISELHSRLGDCRASEWPGDRLILVDRQQTPVGTIALARLLPYLLSPGDLDPKPAPEDPLWEWAADAIEPVEIWGAGVPWVEFWQHLHSQTPGSHSVSQWAIVETTGEILGLLDPVCLLDFAAREMLPPGTDSASNPVETDSHALPPLGDLLEEMPLPMKLQTHGGHILSENRAWRQQFSSGVAGEPHPQPADRPEKDSAGSCSMPDGQNAVWQFVQIPIGIVIGGDSPNRTIARTPNLRLLHPQPGIESSNPNLRAPPIREATPNAYGDTKRTSEAMPKAIAHATRSPTAYRPGAENSSETNETLWLILAQDVSDRQQVAKELAAKNADLIQLNRLKDEFLACISHELKTPLTSVLGLSTLLKDRALGPLSDRQERYAQMIYQSGRHLMNVVNDILDLTRIESGQMELILEPVNLHDVCQRALEQAHLSLPEAEQRERQEHVPSKPGDRITSQFTLEIEPDLTSVVADELRLRQMLYNLLSNAAKFTPPEGSITLKVNRWGGWIAFTISDTGIGIPAEKQHLIFQKFQQLENPLTRQFEGTGLGLVLTQRLARAHGGDVTFISTEGKGSQFTLLLPPSPPQPTTALGESGPLSNRLVLLVEVVPQSIDRLSEQLTALGYQVAIARTGTEALEKARRLQPQTIFLNPLLPLLSGWDVLTLLKSQGQTRQIPIVVVATEADKERALLAGADGFVRTPIDERALAAQMAQIVPSANDRHDRHDAPGGPLTHLTILHLRPLETWQSLDRADFAPSSLDVQPLHSLLSAQIEVERGLHYRVLEAEDLEQAELLARVWQIDAIVLESGEHLHDPVTFLRKFSQYPILAGLPLIPLESETTRAAYQVPGLNVFPCLQYRPDGERHSTPNIAALVQVIHLATGKHSKPTVLVAELAIAEPGAIAPTRSSGENEWLSALIQYLEKAGFQSAFARSWSKVWHRIQTQSVDLLSICWRDSPASPEVLEVLDRLSETPKRPPILVFDRREVQPSAPSDTDRDPLEARLRAIATRILPPSASMGELRSAIEETLKG